MWFVAFAFVVGDSRHKLLVARDLTTFHALHIVDWRLLEGWLLLLMWSRSFPMGFVASALLSAILATSC